MKNIFSVLSLSLIATSTAFGSILKTEPGAQKIETVVVAKSGVVSVENQDIPVGLVGAGLRAKKVVVVNVKVYVAELLSSDNSKFVRTEGEALKSLEQSRTIAIRLNFVRTVEAEKVQVSFRDALSANNVDLKNAAIAKFLEAVSQGGEASEGKSLTIVTQKNADGTETAYYEDTNGKVTKVQGSSAFSKQIMSIWLGTPADDGIAKLKNQIIKGL